MLCPNCAVDVPEGVHFCESCGTRLDAPAPGGPITGTMGPCRCGASAAEVDDQGFCAACGRRRVAPQDPRAHLELPIAPHFGAVTDRGHRHPRNEDAVAVAIEPRDGNPAYALVVCDGVSSSVQPQVASETAANTALQILTHAIREGADAEGALKEAILAAHRDVRALHVTPVPDRDPPETTLVAALVRDGVATIGWVGDSRAYRLDAEGVHQLTHDHSWVNDMVDSNQMTEEEALTAPEAHAITQCLGQEEGEIEPSFLTCELTAPCGLLLCTDGLWNYAPQPEQIEALIHHAPPGTEAVGLARILVDFALEQGGRDNVTVALLGLQTQTGA